MRSRGSSRRLPVPGTVESAGATPADVRPIDDIAVASTSTDAAPSFTAVITTPLDGAPLTRRRARELARSGVSASAAGSPADAPAGSSTAEPAIDTPLTSSTAAPVVAEAADLDQFEAAARLFSFTGETPVQAPAAAAPGASSTAAADVAAHFARGGGLRAAARRASGASFKRMAAASFSVGVVGLVGLMTIGMTMPAGAVAAAGATMTTTAASAGDVLDPDSDQIQAYVAPAQVQNAEVSRTENYAAGTLVDLAGTAGISNFSTSVFTNNPSCSIQWPFATGVTMTYGFGMRSGRMHEGVDFTPGAGAHIQAIADGVVRISTDSGGAYGVTVVIDHVIDGKLVSTRYAHMQYGSRRVQVGEKVSVGEFIGQTGNTGRSFGAHTHVEVLQNGTTPIDPLPWLRSHATC